MGAVSAVGTGVSVVAQHQAQQQAVKRQNAIAQQQYQNNLRIMERQDAIKKDQHAAELAAHAQAQTDLMKQQNLNQIEANRAAQAVKGQLKEKQTEAAFELQAGIAEKIAAQGQVLSTGGTGQSFLMQSLAAEQALGQQAAAINQSLFDANRVYANEMMGVKLKQFSADAALFTNLPAQPRAPGASFIPFKPIKAKGPSGLALAGGLISAGAAGMNTAISAQSMIDQSKVASAMGSLTGSGAGAGASAGAAPKATSSMTPSQIRNSRRGTAFKY